MTRPMTEAQQRRALKTFRNSLGKIPDNPSGTFMERLMMPIELNLIRTWQKLENPRKSALDYAFKQAQLRIQSLLEGTDFALEDSQELEDDEKYFLAAIVNTFDPVLYQPDPQKTIVSSSPSTADNQILDKTLYKEWARGLFRLADSVEFWTKRNGSKGYFTFIESGGLGDAAARMGVDPLEGHYRRIEKSVSSESETEVQVDLHEYTTQLQEQQ